MNRVDHKSRVVSMIIEISCNKVSGMLNRPYDASAKSIIGGHCHKPNGRYYHLPTGSFRNLMNRRTMNDPITVISTIYNIRQYLRSTISPYSSSSYESKL